MILTLVLATLLQAGGSPQARGMADSIEKEITRRMTERAAERASRAERGRREPEHRPVTPEVLATAFKDERARTLLEKARIARLSQDSALLSYDVNSYQRISAGIGFTKLGRDRLIFRTENAGRVRWHRDTGIWINVTGARTVIPGIPDVGEREARKGIAHASDEM
ncbi:MAG TPA: hypothetical protein VIP11_13660, partial [Gemmatimonadaceae bacterium]